MKFGEVEFRVYINVMCGFCSLVNSRVPKLNSVYYIFQKLNFIFSTHGIIR
jgi:hypothetical protein